MKPLRVVFALVLASLGLAGCANQAEPSQKEIDRMNREMERDNRKRAQEQEKMMRAGNPDSRYGGQRDRIR